MENRVVRTPERHRTGKLGRLNNAGTGHSAFAELNYTPELQDGTIEIKRAIKIAEQFEISREFWSHQVRHGRLPAPTEFINATPHMSFVWGEDRIEYLRKRHNALIKNPLFYGMQFSTDPAVIQQWAPLLMEGRTQDQKVAATYMPLGTDVNFGVITGILPSICKTAKTLHCTWTMKSPHCAKTPTKHGT